jgi:hypothetical protein
MRSIFVRVEPLVRQVTGAKVVDLLMVLHLPFEANWVAEAWLTSSRLPPNLPHTTTCARPAMLKTFPIVPTFKPFDTLLSLVRLGGTLPTCMPTAIDSPD